MPTSINYTAKERIILTEDIIWAESSITDLIYSPIVKGAAKQPLKEINSLILTESSAKELFGSEDPINKTVTVSHQATNGENVEMIVTAVMKDLPSNSHVNPKYIANILALSPTSKTSRIY
jgi:putative ABC transport system permease protein